ncbi:unnamed protein product [Rotaria sp. Silwood1]|nr:unnamed protein product [Rotaria sp. Silwood1]
MNVSNKLYSRGGKSGEGYVGIKEVLNLLSSINDHYPHFYTAEEHALLFQNADNIQQRMRVKVSAAYLKHALNIPTNAKHPNPILKVVMPKIDEINDIVGENDPSNQNRFSFVPGLLHKYEMLLAYVSINCSSHCRYCYRLDLFSGISSKEKANMLQVASYIKTFNNLIDKVKQEDSCWDEKTRVWVHKKSGESLFHIREILFSGGDPMNLPNSTLIRYMVLMAEAGIKTIRIGTKELVFNPDRFDNDFWNALDLFHKYYNDIRIEFVGHYVHPYELIDPKTNAQGEYEYDIHAEYHVRDNIKHVLNAMNERRTWIGHINQFPIISGINDSPDILRLLMYWTNRLSITMHNIYACREIFGHKYFRKENTIEVQYKLVEQAKIGLSGIENHGRLIMSTEYGKMEVIGFEKNSVLLRINRFMHGKKYNNSLIKVDLNRLKPEQKFFWLTNDIIQTALTPESRILLNEDYSFNKELKKMAAAHVSKTKKTFCKMNGQVTIEVIGENSVPHKINVNLNGSKMTLATVLAEHGIVEAACQEKLSCCTCVGTVETIPVDVLSPPTEDEMDITDTVIKSFSLEGTQLQQKVRVLNDSFDKQLSSNIQTLAKQENTDLFILSMRQGQEIFARCYLQQTITVLMATS